MEPDGSLAYVASTRDDEVDVIDLAKGLVVGTVKVGLQPSGMALVDVSR
jgi:YVTN family beta-propeller protein